MLQCIVDKSLADIATTVPSVAMHGVGAEDGVHQRPAGARSDPAW